jgi:hypothetical protein
MGQSVGYYSKHNKPVNNSTFKMKCMKKVQWKCMLTATLITMAISSCQKPADDAPAPACAVSMQGLAGNYKLSAMKYKATATAPEQDYLPLLEPCEIDDLLTLNANGTYTSRDAGMVCVPDNSGSGTWAVSGNTLTSDGIWNGTITSYNCRLLVFSLEGTTIPGDKLTFTMTKQ